jgi:biopolymer transport protein TolQ
VVAAAAKKLRESPLAQLYVAAYHEMPGGHDLDALVDDGEEASTERLTAAERAMRSSAALEIAKLERYLPFLATTASACPFIGLFGTVVGVMNSFHGIGAQGSASLAVVAPGISEALVATAAGLGAAIPAVIGYNYFVNRVKHWATEMEGFALDMLNLLSRPAPKLARPAKDGI